jgi:hypothetical protein
VARSVLMETAAVVSQEAGREANGTEKEQEKLEPGSRAGNGR